MNYKELLKSGYKYHFLHKMDGTNIRPYWNDATGRVEFATRGTLCGSADSEKEGYIDFGKLAREIAEEKYPRLLDQSFYRHGITLIFELIHPQTRIITNYGATKDLVLIGALSGNDGVLDSGYDYLKRLAIMWDLNVVQEYKTEATSFYYACEELLTNWADTDLEGTVVTFEDAYGFTVYRLKLKNTSYLDILRVASLCNFKVTKETVEHHGIKNWDELRTVIYGNPAMCEELELEIKQFYEQYLQWSQQVIAAQQALIEAYESLPKFDSKKELAMAIIDNPDKHFFFGMNRHLKENQNLESFWDNNPKLVTHLAERFPTPT